MKPNPYESLPVVPSFTLSSADVRNGEALATEQRSDNISPQLNWSGFPSSTKSFAVTMFDADAPTPSGFWHWAVFNIPATVSALPKNAGAPSSSSLPPGAVQLPNDARLAQYLGAAPPKGTGTHRYFIVVHALDIDSLPLPADATPAYLSFVLMEHTLGRGTLMATAAAP